MQSVKETMTRCRLCCWKHGSLQIAVALMLMGFLPACDRSGGMSMLPHSMKAGENGKKAAEAFKVRHAIFLYRAKSGGQHPYDQPVTEKRVVVLT